MIQPVPKTTRLEMVVEMKIKIFDGQSSGLFSNEQFEKRPVMTIEDFDFHFDDNLKFHVFGNRLYYYKSG